MGSIDRCHGYQARAKKAVKILRQEVEAGGPLKGSATTGLVRLNQKGVTDSTKFFLERLLAGEDLPVTIAGYLKKASKLRSPTWASTRSPSIIGISRSRLRRPTPW